MNKGWSERSRRFLDEDKLSPIGLSISPRLRIGDKFTGCKMCLPLIMKREGVTEIENVPRPKDGIFSICDTHNGYCMNTYRVKSLLK